MHALALLVTAGGSGQVEQIARTFGVDWSHLIAQMISFSIVCILLQRFAYKPVLKMLEERRQQIAQGQANAEQIKAELARIEAQRREVLDKANAEASKLIEEGRAADVVAVDELRGVAARDDGVEHVLVALGGNPVAVAAADAYLSTYVRFCE